MTTAMLVLMGVMMVGMMFGMHRKHKGRGGTERPAASSTATAPGAEPGPSEHVH